MKIANILNPTPSVNKQAAQTGTQEKYKNRLSYNPRVGLREPLIPKKLLTITELSSFGIAIIAIAAGATLGSVPLICIGLLAFAFPFILSSLIGRSYH